MFLCKKCVDFILNPWTFGNILIWTGSKGKGRHGVGMALLKPTYIVIEDIVHQWDKLMYFSIVVYGYKIKMITAYEQTEKSAVSDKEKFSRVLGKTFMLKRCRLMWLLMLTQTSLTSLLLWW